MWNTKSLLALLSLALLMLLGLSRAHAMSVMESPYFTIKSSYDSNYCMALDGSANVVGTSVVIKRCNRQDDAQNWYQDNDRLKNATGNLCVDVWSGNIRSGAELRMYNCHGNANQQFAIWADQISPKGNLSYCFDVANDNMKGVTNLLQLVVLAMQPVNMRDGARVQLWNCQGRPSASWINSKQTWGEEYFTIKSNVNSNLCLGLERAADSPGVSAVIKRCDVADTTQSWYKFNGLLKNRSGNMCMDAWGGYVGNGTRFKTYPCHGHRNQRFAFVGDKITPLENGGLCVVANNNAVNEGNFVLLWGCSGLNSASWSRVSLDPTRPDNSGGGARTRYPIIMVHGFGGCAGNNGDTYWPGLASWARSSGLPIYVPCLPAPNTTEVLSKALLDFMDRNQIAKAHFIGHSQGGVTIRRFVLKNEARVASLNTVGTPNKGTVLGCTGKGGSPAANCSLPGGRITATLYPVFYGSGNGNWLNALNELSFANMAEFNKLSPSGLPTGTPDTNNCTTDGSKLVGPSYIPQFSWTGAISPNWSRVSIAGQSTNVSAGEWSTFWTVWGDPQYWPLRIAAGYHGVNVVNDGFITACSSVFGSFNALLGGVDHGDEVAQPSENKANLWGRDTLRAHIRYLRYVE